MLTSLRINIGTKAAVRASIHRGKERLASRAPCEPRSGAHLDVRVATGRIMSKLYEMAKRAHCPSPGRTGPWSWREAVLSMCRSMISARVSSSADQRMFESLEKPAQHWARPARPTILPSTPHRPASAAIRGQHALAISAWPLEFPETPLYLYPLAPRGDGGVAGEHE